MTKFTTVKTPSVPERAEIDRRLDAHMSAPREVWVQDADRAAHEAVRYVRADLVERLVRAIRAIENGWDEVDAAIRAVEGEPEP